jgi:hypothetical protein
MHLSGSHRGIGQARGFPYRQGIYICAQADHATISPAFDDCGDTATSNAGHHVVATELSQLIGHEPGSAVNVKQQFRVTMKVVPPSDGLGCEMLDIGMDRHRQDWLKR